MKADEQWAKQAMVALVAAARLDDSLTKGSHQRLTGVFRECQADALCQAMRLLRQLANESGRLQQLVLNRAIDQVGDLVLDLQRRGAG